jgi:hypothetical protein
MNSTWKFCGLWLMLCALAAQAEDKTAANGALSKGIHANRAPNIVVILADHK